MRPTPPRIADLALASTSLPGRQRCTATTDRERVEVGCMGGRGRTGTALACVAVLDGVPADQAVDYVRRHYHPDAVETEEQRQFVAEFG